MTKHLESRTNENLYFHIKKIILFIYFHLLKKEGKKHLNNKTYSQDEHCTLPADVAMSRNIPHILYNQVYLHLSKVRKHKSVYTGCGL